MRLARPPNTGIPGLTYTEKKLKGLAPSRLGKRTRTLSATTERPKSSSSHHDCTGVSGSGCHQVLGSWSPARSACCWLDGVRAKRCP